VQNANAREKFKVFDFLRNFPLNQIKNGTLEQCLHIGKCNGKACNRDVRKEGDELCVLCELDEKLSEEDENRDLLTQKVRKI
jgi:hypothetical protein